MNQHPILSLFTKFELNWLRNKKVMKNLIFDTLDQRFQRAFEFKPKQPSPGRASEASEGGRTSGHPGP